MPERMKGMKGIKRVKRVKHVTAPAREASRCYRQYLPALISFLPRSCASSAGESFPPPGRKKGSMRSSRRHSGKNGLTRRPRLNECKGQ